MLLLHSFYISLSRRTIKPCNTPTFKPGHTQQLLDTAATMTKIWCPICHKSKFDIDPPTQRTVMEHIRDIHDDDSGQNSASNREQMRKRQNEEWEKRKSDLGEQLDADAQQMGRQYEEFVDDAKMKEVPEDTTDPVLLQQWKQLMEVYDDSEGEETDVDVSPDHDTRVDAHGVDRVQAAPRSAGQRYATIADRTTQATTIVERTTTSGLRQSMLIPAASQEVGWDSMAEMGFTPAGAWEMREDRQGQDVRESRMPVMPGVLTDQFSEAQDQGEIATPDVVEAANILMSMRAGQAAPTATSAGDQHLQHIEQELEAAAALEQLHRGEES